MRYWFCLLLSVLFWSPFASAAKKAEPDPCTRWLAPGADLQAAIDGAAPGPLTLCLKRGNYPLQTMLRIGRDHVHLRGSGAKTVLRLQDGVREPVIVAGDIEHQVPEQPIRDIVIERMRLVGATASTEFTEQRPWLSNSAVVIRHGEQIVMRKLVTENCRSACLLTEHDSRGVLIEDNLVTTAVWDGLSFNRGYEITVRNNLIRGNTAAGITVEHIEDSLIENNTIEGNGSHGIYLSDSWRNRIVGNRFIKNHRGGLMLTCALRYHGPEQILCWDNSISQGNLVENNLFSGNEYGYIVGADRAANCSRPDWIPNIWRNNRDDAPDFDARPEEFGYCFKKE